MIPEETFDRLDFTRIRGMIAEACATPGAKRKAMSLAPCENPREAIVRFSETEEALCFKQSLPFSVCAGTDALIESLEKERYLAPKEFLKLSTILEGFSTIERRISSASDEEYPLIKQAGSGVKSIEGLRARIVETVDEDGVKESCSPRLAELRRSMASERRVVMRGLESMISSRPEIFQESAIHFREGRLVLAVRRERGDELQGIVHATSSGGATVFIEPFESVTGNNRLRSLKEEEREETERILLELAGAVRENVHIIQRSLKAVEDLDFIFGRAQWASRFSASRVDPDAEFLDILNARHPLLELKRKVVPLYLKLSPDTKILLISGPNAGGKSVVLKSIGILSLLSLCGLHLPASADTRIPFFKKIFIDIGDEQSIDDNLSSFTAHLANLKRILEDADETSLVLLDELGSSTSPEEGGALGMAVLSALYEKGATVIATTHLESLKYFVEQHHGMQNAGMEFVGHPTYRLIMGIPGTSNALSIADDVGFPKEVTSKARQYLRPELVEMSNLIRRLSEERLIAEELRMKLEQEYLYLKEQEEKYRAREAELDERQKKFDTELINEKKRQLSEARRDIENLVKSIRESGASRESVLSAKRLLKEQEDALKASEKEKHLLSSQANIEAGMRVRSKKIRKEGTVVDIHDRSGEVLVEFGTLKISLPLSDLEPLSESSPAKSFVQVKDEVPFDTRLSLRGMYAEEAYERLSFYVTEALSLGVQEVYIVHGKGTGVLRNLVMEFARTDRRVSSFRVGEPFEGGDGVTVLRLAV